MLCSYSATTGARTATNLNLQSAATPAIRIPVWHKVAFYENFGPAGERIYSAKGAFLRNLIGYGTSSAIWSPDESRLVLQEGFTDSLVFSFKTKQVTPFVHKGPAHLFVLDWR